MDTAADKPTILIVDDTPANLALLSEALKPAFRAKVATDGEKALKIAMSGDPPDLILLDVIMPGMDGYEVCRHLKSSPITRHIPVIFATAMNEVEVRPSSSSSPPRRAQSDTSRQKMFNRT